MPYVWRVCWPDARIGRILNHLRGGDLELHWDEASNHVFMTGPAEEVFEGEWPEEP